MLEILYCVFIGVLYCFIVITVWFVIELLRHKELLKRLEE